MCTGATFRNATFQPQTTVPNVFHSPCEVPLASANPRRSVSIHRCELVLFTRHLRFNPWIGDAQSLLERNLRLPAKHLPQASVVAIAAAHPLRAAETVALVDFLSRDAGNEFSKSIDRRQFIRTQVESVTVIRRQQANQPFHAVIYIHERTSLLAIAPDFDFVILPGQRYFTADRSGSFFFSAFICAKRSIHIVEAHDAGFEAVVFVVVTAQFFGKQFLPPIT